MKSNDAKRVQAAGNMAWLDLEMTGLNPDYDAIIDAACEAWRKLVALPEEIKSIGLREWASRF